MYVIMQVCTIIAPLDDCLSTSTLADQGTAIIYTCIYH